MSLIKHRLVLQRKFLTQLEIEGNFELSKKIRDMLIIEIDKSKEIMLTASNDIIYAFDYRNPEKSYEIQNNIRCECGLDVFCGIPCRHIISLYRFQNTQLPLSLFNRRWFLNSTNEMQSNDRFFQPQYQNTGQLKYIDHQDHDDTINSDQRIRFISLFYSLKELASLASRSIESSVQVSNWVNIITNEILNINDNESDININDSGQKEIRDIRDTLAKRKGRPKKAKRYRKPYQLSCMICLCNHATESCQHYDQLLAVRNQNTQQYSGIPLCCLCFSNNHSIGECPFRK